MIQAFVRRHFYGRKSFQSLFRKLHSVALGGMNYGNVGVEDSGETGVLEFVRRSIGDRVPIIVDVGANAGQYAREVIRIFQGECMLHCLEPSPAAFEALSRNLTSGERVILHNLGLAAVSGENILHSEERGGTGSSLMAKSLPDGIHNHSLTEQIIVQTLDEFCGMNGLDRIDLLKLDVEGGELDVLKGGKRLLERGTVPYIQFEYGEGSVAFRTFLRDFHEMLRPRYRLFRILRDGLEEHQSYSLNQEILLTANYLAVLDGAPLPRDLGFVR